MNRSIYFDLCEKRLTLLCYSVELRGKLNILNYNLHCEDFYVHFFNLLFGYSLKNTNQEKHNFEGIDLIDENGGNDSNLLIVFYVQIMPDDFVMQLHRF